MKVEEVKKVYMKIFRPCWGDVGINLWCHVVKKRCEHSVSCNACAIRKVKWKRKVWRHEMNAKRSVKKAMG